MGLLVCFAGGIGSGKSSVCKTTAKRLGWRCSGFGDYVRSELRRLGGNADSREELQDLGQSLVDKDPEALCRAVLEAVQFTPGENCLIDGIRHVDVFNILRTISSPSVGKLIYLSVDANDRMVRVATRDGDVSDFNRAEKHKTEQEVTLSLPLAADHVIDATADVNAVVQECLDCIGNWRES